MRFASGTGFGISLSIIGSLGISTPVIAAQAIDAAAVKVAAVEPEADDEIIVTGSSRAQRRFDASFAVNSLSQEEVRRIAPKNFAELLGIVPGIHVEATGGEVQNVTRVRGIPTDRGYLIFQQDGLPLFHEIDGVFFNSGDGMNRFDLMTERVEVVRGGPAPIYASSAAAIANNITVSGGEESRGMGQVTLGDTGLYRLDLVQSGKIAERTYFAVGGFLRHHDGYRDNGYPNDRGGQIRANIKRELDNGFLRLSGTYLNDKNAFYLPIPLADPRNPAVSLDPFIDFFTGTMNSPALRGLELRYRDGNNTVQTLQRDLADGRHIRFGNIGLQYEGDFDGWLVAANIGYTDGKNSFDAFYSTTNPADAGTFAAGFLPAARTAFGTVANPVTRLGYAIAGSNGTEIYDPARDSGLVMSGQYRAVESDFYSGQGTLSVTRKFVTGIGTHDVKVGLYGAAYGATNLAVYNDMLIEVRGKPRTLDLVAYGAAGQVLGSVTDRGTLRATTTLNQGETDGKVLALYANDTWEIVPGLRLDAGIRHEWYDYSGFALLSTGGIDLGNPTTLADNATRGFTGTRVTTRIKPTATNWTVGLGYDFTSNLGVYGRASTLEVPPQATVALNTAPTIITTVARQYEAGIRASFGRSYLFVTGFYTRFDPFNASFVAFNPVTGRNDQSVPFIGEAIVKGVEIDGRYTPADWFSLAGSVTVADPQYRNLQNSAGADPSAVNGNQIIREPKLFGNIRPTFFFETGETQVEVYGRVDFVGKRFVDLFNRTSMAAYQTLAAGVTVNRDAWRIQLVGDNLTNARGVTEGNPRTDQLAGQDASQAIYGRPLFGRNFRFIVSRSW